MPDKAKAGWERVLYYGVAGTTAATLVDFVIDIDVDKGNTQEETTDRGDGTSIPIETFQVVSRACTVTFSMRYYGNDPKIAALIAAAETGADVAIRVIRGIGGKTEVDADVKLSYTSPGELKGGMPVEFTATMSKDSGRNPVIVSA